MSNRVLLVDDEPRNLTLLEDFLRPQGYELFRACDGGSALTAFEKTAPDLILLDYVMPGLDGIDVLTHVRASQRPHTPVVLLTAHSDRELRLRGTEAGADEFLEKPIDQPILLARVRSLLALKESRDALQASRDELERRHDALELAQREHRELMAFIVHDLKTPLTIVHLTIDSLKRKLGSAEKRIGELLAEAGGAAARLNTMIFNMQSIARLEQTSLDLEREPIEFGELLRTVMRTFVGRAEDRGIVLLAPEPSAPLPLQADRALLQRVVENVVENAFRYTPRGGRIAVLARAADGVEIAVSNDGPVIPAVDRLRIFDKFQRGSGETANHGNAGLGLYFCKRAVAAHGGTITVADSPEWPTTFLINLPV